MKTMAMTHKTCDEKIQPPYRKSAKEYSQSTTIHGMSYLFENRLVFYEKAVWLLFVISAIIFAILSSLSTYRKWKDEPILTSVATTAYPVQKVPFPSISICPQGGANDIVDAAIFKQFVEYLEDKNLSYDDLSESQVRDETYDFLNDKYPGSRQLPNQLVRMLGSPDVDPENKIQARAILNPEGTSECSTPNTTDDNGNIRKKRNTVYGDCPNDFRETGYGSCWHTSTQSMTYDEAVAYCGGQGNGGSAVLTFSNPDEIEYLYEKIKPKGSMKNEFQNCSIAYSKLSDENNYSSQNALLF